MNVSVRIVAATLVVGLVSIATPAQRAQRARRAAQPQVLERDVRADIGFLASDALQGRGSATGYERIAAEYIGSQFRRAGLEPAGDADPAGAKGFVQRVPLDAKRFTAPPTLTIDASGARPEFVYGRDFAIPFLLAPTVSGPLADANGDPATLAGAIGVFTLPAGATDDALRPVAGKLFRAGAVGLVVIGGASSAEEWAKATAELPKLEATGAGGPSRPFVMMRMSAAAGADLAKAPLGSKATFGGTVETDTTAATWNVVGVIRGTSPTEAIVLSAHLDHLGVRTGPDPIYNGADDDASGCAAVLALARVLGTGPKPRRSIYFVCFGSEETGGAGSDYFVDHSPVPLDQMVAAVNFEMIGRPDAAVKPGELWVTGFDRSDLGTTLAKRGARFVADPHPEQNFFERSDNFSLAQRGVVAHTISSFGLHADYHKASDEISTIDFDHMTRSIASVVAPIRWLATTTYRPAWLPGKSPAR